MSLRNLRQTATAGKYTDVTQRKSPFSKRQSPLNTSTQYTNPVFHLPFPPVIPQRRDGQDTPLRDKATPAWGQTQPYIATVTITNLVVSVENLLFADSAICREPTHTYTATHEVLSATLTGSPARTTHACVRTSIRCLCIAPSISSFTDASAVVPWTMASCFSAASSLQRDSSSVRCRSSRMRSSRSWYGQR